MLNRCGGDIDSAIKQLGELRLTANCRQEQPQASSSHASAARPQASAIPPGAEQCFRPPSCHKCPAVLWQHAQPLQANQQVSGCACTSRAHASPCPSDLHMEFQWTHGQRHTPHCRHHSQPTAPHQGLHMTCRMLCSLWGRAPGSAGRPSASGGAAVGGHARGAAADCTWPCRGSAPGSQRAACVPQQHRAVQPTGTGLRISSSCGHLAHECPLQQYPQPQAAWCTFKKDAKSSTGPAVSPVWGCCRT